MDSETKKYLAIGVGVAAGVLSLLFIKNKLQEATFKPLDHALVMDIFKKAKKDNFAILKQVSTAATNIAMQMGSKQVDPAMVKAYLESPESPLNPIQSFEANYQKVCESMNVTYSDFNNSVEFYIKNEDPQIKYLVEEQDRYYQTSMSGRLPQPKVTVPESLTKERLLEIQQKLTLKKYLIQVEIFRRLKGKTQEEIMSNPQLMSNLPNQELEEEKILEEEGVSTNDDPHAAVFAAAILQHKNDVAFKTALNNIENDFKKIFTRYLPKMQSNKMTEEELNELEDELIYSQPQGY